MVRFYVGHVRHVNDVLALRMARDADRAYNLYSDSKLKSKIKSLEKSTSLVLSTKTAVNLVVLEIPVFQRPSAFVKTSQGMAMTSAFE